jgi:hypothetical protein
VSGPDLVELAVVNKRFVSSVANSEFNICIINWFCE